MDALVDGLLEELNCDVVFKIPIFGGIPIYESVVVTWIIMAAVFLLCFFLGRNLSVENPGRRQVAVEAGVKFLNDFFSETLGEKGKDYIPYLATVIIYRNSKPDRFTWLQTADKGYERHRSTRCNEHSSYRGGRNQGKGHQKVA